MENLSTPLPKVPFLPLVHLCLTSGTALESKTNPGLPCSLIPLVAWPPSSSSLIMAGAWDLGSSKLCAVMCGVVVGSPPTWHTAYCKNSRSAAPHRINCWRPWLACCSTVAVMQCCCWSWSCAFCIPKAFCSQMSTFLQLVRSCTCTASSPHTLGDPSISCVHQA